MLYVALLLIGGLVLRTVRRIFSLPIKFDLLSVHKTGNPESISRVEYEYIWGSTYAPSKICKLFFIYILKDAFPLCSRRPLRKQ